jgi:hypothetical protein
MPMNDMKSTPRFMTIELADERKLTNQGFERIAPNRGRRRRSATWLAIVVLGLFAYNAKAAQVVDQNNARPSNPWLQEHLLNSNVQLPFSFVYGRQPSKSLLKSWPEKTTVRQLDGGRIEETLLWTDPKTGLQVRITAIDYIGSPVVE